LSLYSENIGLAIIGEVPLVIVDVQRLGPATGGATTVGQGDVQFVRWGTAGGYPIVALAPSSVPECYALTRKAFDLAERFRCPVFLVTDKELNMTTATVEVSDYERPAVRDREVLTDALPPYRFTPAGTVPPLAQYGGDALVRFTGSTHDERAFITKAPAKVAELNEHLRAKIEDHASEVEMAVADIEPGATTLVVSYGVTAGAVREAVATMRRTGKKISALTVQSLWPVPERAIRAAAAGVKRVVVAELNHGQYRREFDRLALDAEVVSLNRVDGELIAPDAVIEAVR
jgi:2-oxoglutarate ferredoxin oxidoreductase subunit alpha